MTLLLLSVRDLQPSDLDRTGERGAPALSVSTLRQKPLPDAIRTIRASGANRVCIVATTEDLASYGPVLALFALSAGLRRQEYFDLSTSARYPVSTIRTLASGAKITGASVRGIAALRRRTRALDLLERTPPTRAPWSGHLRRVLYLKPGPHGNVLAGGSVGHVAGVANALLSHGAEVRLLAASEQFEIDPRVKQMVHLKRGSWALPYEVNSIMYANVYQAAAERITAEWTPDLCYERYTPHDLTGLALQRRHVPWVLEYNGSEVWAQRNWGKPMRLERVARRAELVALRHADLVVVVSEPLRDEVIADGVEPDRVLFYPNCVDPTRFDPSRFDAAQRRAIRARFGLEPSDLVLTFIGTFGQWHGTDVLADTIRKLIDEHAELLRARRVRFLLVGAGLHHAYVRDTIGGEREFVRMPGLQPQSEAPGILAASDILLSPHKANADGSRFFGSPTKLIEYLAMERLVISSDLDQLGDIARGWQPTQPPPAKSVRSDIMWLVTPGSVDELAATIRRACEAAEDERAAFGMRARAAMLRGFTWDANVACVLDRLAAVSSRRTQV